MALDLQTRRSESATRLDALRARLDPIRQLLGDNASVYVTGSYGRGEAGTHSDVDAFVISEDTIAEDVRDQFAGEMAACTKAAELRPYESPEYEVFHTIGSLVGELGTPEDDSKNTFTARILMLLESRPLTREDIYARARDAALAAYWTDFAGHEHEFMPVYLVNDVLRMWRTFCVNYEARTEKDPAEERAKRKVKNFKLKHSRLLTCFSALAALVREHTTRGTVTVDAAARALDMSPTERIASLSGVPQCATAAGAVIKQYEAFLAQTDQPTSALVARLLEGDEMLFADQNTFGKLIYEVLRAVGTKDGNVTALFRALTV
jgi:predicted nucleotidyltransferase